MRRQDEVSIGQSQLFVLFKRSPYLFGSELALLSGHRSSVLFLDPMASDNV